MDNALTFLDAASPHAPTNQELELAATRAREAAEAPVRLENGDMRGPGKRVHVMRFNDAGRQVHTPHLEHVCTRPDGSTYSIRLPVA